MNGEGRLDVLLYFGPQVVTKLKDWIWISVDGKAELCALTAIALLSRNVTMPTCTTLPSTSTTCPSPKKQGPQLDVGFATLRPFTSSSDVEKRWASLMGRTQCDNLWDPSRGRRVAPRRLDG